MHGKFAKLTCEIERLSWATCPNFFTIVHGELLNFCCTVYRFLVGASVCECDVRRSLGQTEKSERKTIWKHHHAEESGRITMTNDEAIDYLRKEISDDEMGTHLAIMDQEMANLNINFV